ncbi:MAG: flavoprotein [Phycisphaerae bacterium]|jgi:phosphopantothenoylcysteine decarboxylase/phosphopantothenate--cysteine ligase
MANSRKNPTPDLRSYEVLVTVCGGIAAFKVCDVVSTLAQRGCGTTVAMTEAATRFVGPTTFQALTGRRVFTSLWHAEDVVDVHHIGLPERADLVLVAPATANIVGKVAAGIADDLVSTLLMSLDSPVLFAPAMNERMWANPVTQRNVTALTDLGHRFIGPGEGWLACRTVGAGRMAEPTEIVDEVTTMLERNPPKAAAPS